MGILNEFIAGFCVNVMFILDEFMFEIGYCKDEDDFEGLLIMFMFVEVIGFLSRMILLFIFFEYFARKVVLKMDVIVYEMRVCVNEVFLYLI